MNPTKVSKLCDLETVRNKQARYDALSIDAQAQERLGHLRAFIDQLSQTPTGKADLSRRVLAFGPCERAAGESHRHFYGRLRVWIDTELQGVQEEPEPASDMTMLPPRRRGNNGSRHRSLGSNLHCQSSE